jgi:hypothetical protein
MIAYACSRASIAASTFGGDIGNSVSRRPIARSIALAMAVSFPKIISGLDSHCKAESSHH